MTDGPSVPPHVEESVAAKALERGTHSGKMGLGQDGNPFHPGSPEGQSWLEGWHKGQECLLAGIKEKSGEYDNARQ